MHQIFTIITLLGYICDSKKKDTIDYLGAKIFFLAIFFVSLIYQGITFQTLCAVKLTLSLSFWALHHLCMHR